jgi:hypothetical protein
VTFNTTFDLLKTLYKVVQDEKIRDKVFEIKSALLLLQEQQFAADARYEEQAAELRDLRRQLDERDRWNEEAEKYDLFHPAQGMTVYKLRADCNHTDGEILACPNCFGNRKISILNHPAVGNLNYLCPTCSFKILPVPGQVAWGGESRIEFRQ